MLRTPLSFPRPAATYACLAPIAAGVVLASGGEPLFHPTGVALQVAANVFRR